MKTPTYNTLTNRDGLSFSSETTAEMKRSCYTVEIRFYVEIQKLTEASGE